MTITAPTATAEIDAVACYGAITAAQARAGGVDVAEANTGLADLAAADVTRACLAFRQSTNAVRLTGHTGLAEVLDSMAAGGLVATTFNAATTTATLRGSTVKVTGTGLMCTGIGHAEWVMVEATHTNDILTGARSVIVVPADAVVDAARPPFRGLTAADNAIISIDATLAVAHLVGGPGQAAQVIAAPYEAGLTLAAAAVGAARTVTNAVQAHGIDRLDRTRREQLGEHLASLAATEALIDALPGRAPHAGWASKAAKVAATRAAHTYCQWARTVIGSRTYTTTHPLTVLEADLEGLLHQAPTNHGAAHALTDHLP